jgi:hypothetical protein
MSLAWVAGSVRARLLLGHRLDAEAARQLGRSESLAEALALLSGTTYSEAAGADSLEKAQRAVAARLLLELRVLAAWLPRAGADAVRALAGWFELVNVEDRLAYLAGGPLHPPFQLGILSSVWETAARTQSAAELRAVLGASSWGDPGGDEAQDIHAALRLGWARRVAVRVPEARAWAAGAAAILLAEELFLSRQRPHPTLVRRADLGSDWADAGSVAELRSRLPRRAAWALARITEPAELWHAELAWWRTAAAEAEALVRSRREGRDVVVGAVVLLGFDALRVTTALAVAAGPRSSASREVLDALC